MHTIFVTGADGYVGTQLVRQLLEHNYDVVAGVRNRARKLAYEREHGRAFVCDVSDAINVARAVASADPDALIHLAGISHAWAAVEQPLTAYQSLVTGWANVLDAVRRVCPRARTLMISAGDVYGKGGANGEPIAETTTCRPATTFGSLKLAAESIARTYFQKFHVNVSIARPFSYTGPEQPGSFFLASVARQISEWDNQNGTLTLSLPDLDCQRDVLHVADVVDAYERLLTDGKPNEVYNVCSSQTNTCREIIERMAQKARVQVAFEDAPSAAADDAEVIPVLCGDNRKLRSELGWEATHTLDGALQDLIRSFQNAPATSPT